MSRMFCCCVQNRAVDHQHTLSSMAELIMREAEIMADDESV